LRFFIDIILPAALGTGVHSAKNRNENKEYFRGGKDGGCVGLITVPPLFADYLEILGYQTYWSPKGVSRSVYAELYRFVYIWQKGIKKFLSRKQFQTKLLKKGLRGFVAIFIYLVFFNSV